MDFFANSPLDPDYADEETEAKIDGRAYHKRIVEGRAAFEAIYASELGRAEYPDALDTVKEITAHLKYVGGPIKGLSKLNKPELIQILLEHDPDVEIWDYLVAQHKAQHEGKIFLAAKLIRRIEIAAMMIERDPELSHAFSGGAPEVSVFWVDRRTGVPCKARLDYWKPKAIIDLKSFENSRMDPVDQAVAKFVASWKSHIQAAFYLRSIGPARRLIAEGKWSGDIDPALVRALGNPQPDMTWMYVFQQKGRAPVVRGKVLPDNSSAMRIGRIEIDEALLKFARCWAHFGTLPWVDSVPISEFDDSEFPVYLAA
jgi:PDDEXK-like domain of unknown function (DUF3799)